MRLTRRISRKVAGVLPQAVTDSVRGLVLSWGIATSRWRMAPSFVIVGAQRSGTTTLFRMLSEHPQVVRPTLNKGMAYFDLNYDKGWSWYLGHFPLRRRRLHGSGTGALVTFESSGYYMFHPLAAARIAQDLPEVKIVAMLRDPVDRAHSAHRHEQRRGFETEDFEHAIELEPSRTAGEADRIIADPTYASYSLQHHAYLGRGEYVTQVERLIGAVGRERLYVIDAGLFFDDPVREFGRLCRWLGLAEQPDVDGSVWNAAPRAPMEPELREQLSSYFQPFDARLGEVLGQPMSWVGPARPDVSSNN